LFLVISFAGIYNIGEIAAARVKTGILIADKKDTFSNSLLDLG
jgi:hypothetical protein